MIYVVEIFEPDVCTDVGDSVAFGYFSDYQGAEKLALEYLDEHMIVEGEIFNERKDYEGERHQYHEAWCHKLEYENIFEYDEYGSYIRIYTVSLDTNTWYRPYMSS